MKQFKDSVAVVTGGGSGIGAAICRALAARGAKVAVADIEADAAESVAKAIRDSGGTALAHQTDVTSDESVDRLAAAVKATFGTCHLAVANAGVMAWGRLDQRTRQDWDWVLSVNLFGVIRTVQAFLPMLKANPGNAHIVMTSSMSGLLAAGPAKGVYNASKQAVMAYGETLRAELADEGVGVTLLLPAGVKTQIINSGRNRPASTGQANPTPDDLKMTIRGLGGDDVAVEPDYAVRNLIAGIEQNQIWVITHDSAQRPVIAERFAGIMEAFERAKS